MVTLIFKFYLQYEISKDMYCHLDIELRIILYYILKTGTLRCSINAGFLTT